ncbi:MAG: hypothetical protein ACPG06_07400 [Alphaproteobacteria bacterium]
MAEISLIRGGPDDLAKLERLLQLYLHDFSSYAGAQSEHGLIGDDGRFAYHDHDGGLAGFLKNPDRSAWFFEMPHPHTNSGKTLAGFALVNAWSPSGRDTDYVVAEFHVLRKFRRTGLGMTAAHKLFEALPGTWELGILDDNVGARAFWPKVVQSGPCRNAELHRGDGDRWDGDIWRFLSHGS